jgi:dihydrofolate reductase
MLKASVFIATSVDGFIARSDGAIDWLPADGGEDHGYNAFMATVDALVLGRNTFETVLGFGVWPYGPKPVFVLTNRPLDVPPPAEAVLEVMSGAPAQIVSTLASRGFQHVYVDGGITIQQFLEAGLIQQMTITRVPRLIGTGIPLFGALPHDIPLRHLATTHYPSGLVTSIYAVNTDQS